MTIQQIPHSTFRIHDGGFSLSRKRSVKLFLQTVQRSEHISVSEGNSKSGLKLAKEICIM